MMRRGRNSLWVTRYLIEVSNRLNSRRPPEIKVLGGFLFLRSFKVKHDPFKIGNTDRYRAGEHCSLAQLVESACLTSKRPLVRIQ